jgi:hypothetical protein
MVKRFGRAYSDVTDVYVCDIFLPESDLTPADHQIFDHSDFLSATVCQ